MNWQMAFSLLLLFLAGCAEPPAPAPQSSSEAAASVETDVPSTEPVLTSEARTEEARQASEIRGTVVGIVDGDIIDILTDDKKQIRIRLHGVDAPEAEQPWGIDAKLLLDGLVAGKPVRVVIHGEDRYGRMIGDVWVRTERSAKSDPDSNVNFMMVANGRAWHFVEDAPGREDLAKGEQTARGINLALWSDPNPVAPWDWRKKSKEDREKQQ